MRILSILAFSVFIIGGILVTSCSKKNDVDLFQSTTDLQVYVKDSSGQKIQGANVRIFLSQADRDNNANVVQEGVISNQGFVYFSQLQTEKYYILVSRQVVNTTQIVKSDSGAPLTDKLQTGVTVVM